MVKTQQKSSAVSEPPQGERGTYETNMKHVVRRVRNIARKQRSVMYGSLIVVILIALAIFVLDMFSGDLQLFKALAVGLVVLWIVIYSKAVAPFRVPITCLSCNNQVNLNKAWLCGYCDDEKSSRLMGMQTFVSYRLPLEECASCEEKAPSVECPYCEEPVVFDVDEFNKQETAGTKRFGMARFL